MLLRPTDIEVPEDDPFRHDALARRELEPPLTQFVTQADGPFVLALDGAWGTGKTTFLRMWQQRLNQASHATLYLNAWQTDFAKDPLVAVTSELSATIDLLAPKGEKGKKIRSHLKKARTLAESIAKRSLPAAIRIATAGVIDTSDFIENEVVDLAGKLVEDQIAAYEKGKSEIANFRKTLTELVTEVKNVEQKTETKVVIIVDELDRCRPTYAVELLERIKHLFDIPSVIFILGIDRTQLEHSIKAIYGSDFDAAGYLRRFIDLDYRLPEPKEGNYCAYLFQQLGVNDLFQHRDTGRRELDSLREILSTLMSAAKMSLRTQIQTISRLRITLQTIPSGHYIFELTLAVLAFLREWSPRKYEAFFSGSLNVDDLVEELEGLPGMGKSFTEHSGHLIEATLLAGASELKQRSRRLERYGELARMQDDSPETTRAKIVSQIITELKSSIRHGGPGFKHTAERLALTKHFVSFGETDNR